MELKRVLICVALMALVTYIPRVLPVTVFRKQIRSRFIRSFLDYTPYAVLGALTFPDVFFSTGHLFSAAGMRRLRQRWPLYWAIRGKAWW